MSSDVDKLIYRCILHLVKKYGVNENTLNIRQSMNIFTTAATAMTTATDNHNKVKTIYVYPF